MNHYIPFETAFQLLVTAHVASVMLLLVTANVCLAVIETLEEANS